LNKSDQNQAKERKNLPKGRFFLVFHTTSCETPNKKKRDLLFAASKEKERWRRIFLFWGPKKKKKKKKSNLFLPLIKHNGGEFLFPFDATKTEEKGEKCREFLQWKIKRETKRVLGEFQEFLKKNGRRGATLFILIWVAKIAPFWSDLMA
jgi:hypothetical protein